MIDEVRAMGTLLGIPEDLVWRHPFPGPGIGIRILGAVTPELVEIVRQADHIFISEIKSAGLYRKISQALAAVVDAKAVGVMGDQRTYEYIVALRAVTTIDFMTADVCPLWPPFWSCGPRLMSRFMSLSWDG
jgi:GMP synthase (glutamine-hydrolysing)